VAAGPHGDEEVLVPRQLDRLDDVDGVETGRRTDPGPARITVRTFGR